MKLQSDLREFVELLNSRKVDYLVVGGHAVAFHGYPRFTGDIDFFVRPTRENADKIMDALLAFGFGDLGLEPESFTTPDTVVQLGRPPNRIDLLTTISAVDFDDAWAGREQGTLDGLPVFFIGRDALIRNKRAASRAKDRADLEALEESD